MISIVENPDNHTYDIKSKYDPALIEYIKQVPGRRWNPESKVWSIPSDKLGWLVKSVSGTKYEAQIVIYSSERLNENAKLGAMSDIPDIDISKVPFYIKQGAKPYPHQIDTLKYAIDRYNQGNHSGFILADEPGLGKTASAMNVALYGREHWGFKHCLIISCVNSAKYNWISDIADHTDGKEIPYLIGERLKKNKTIRRNTGNKERVEDLVTRCKYGIRNGDPLPYFLVVNIEAIRYRIGRTYPFADQIIEWINRGDLNMIVLDEVHKNTSPSSLQGKQLSRIKQKIQKDIMWLPMTGTPITNKPTDVYLPLKLINGHAYNNYYLWCQNYCVYGGFGDHEIVAYKNIEQLKSMLQGNMLRRLKVDVLKDLPPKLPFIEYVENTPYQEKLYAQVLNDVLKVQDEILGSMNPLTKLLRLRQVNGSPELIDENLSINSPDYITKNAKLQKTLEIVKSVIARKEKVVIFSEWVQPLKTLYKYVSKLTKVCCVVGTMSVEDREKHKKVFMENPDYKVMLGTIGAMGTSHTLTSANNVIFYDEPYTPADKLQAEDRVHRIGASKSINIYTLITADTIDHRVHEILYTKSAMSDYIVDDKLDLHNNPELLRYLLSDSTK